VFAPVKNMISLLQSIMQIYRLSKPSRDFGKGKTALPRLMQVQTISACNGKCLFCPYPYVSRELPQGKMEWEIYKKIVDECVYFSSLQMFTPMLQNEPLLDKDICKAISYFKEKSRGRVPIFIVTNGYLLTRSLISQIVDSGLDHLIISINAHKKETYEELMPGFQFEKIVANIENLLSSNLRQTKVTLRFLENQKNREEISEALAYWHSRKVHTEVLSFISNRADTVDISSLKSKRAEMLLSSKIKQKVFSCFSNCCILPFYQMNILFNGDVLLCCNDWRRIPTLGNVKREKLRVIWESQNTTMIKNRIWQKDYKSIEACEGCSVTEYFESWV
jgi:radical SAM protein with 4Fe4S-binding SPASM domain